MGCTDTLDGYLCGLYTYKTWSSLMLVSYQLASNKVSRLSCYSYCFSALYLPCCGIFECDKRDFVRGDLFLRGVTLSRAFPVSSLRLHRATADFTAHTTEGRLGGHPALLACALPV
jgi:hypothetical protein